LDPGAGDAGGESEGYAVFPASDFDDDGDEVEAKYAGLRPDASPCSIYHIPAPEAGAYAHVHSGRPSSLISPSSGLGVPGD